MAAEKFAQLSDFKLRSFKPRLIRIFLRLTRYVLVKFAISPIIYPQSVSLSSHLLQKFTSFMLYVSLVHFSPANSQTIGFARTTSLFYLLPPVSSGNDFSILLFFPHWSKSAKFYRGFKVFFRNKKLRAVSKGKNFKVMRKEQKITSRSWWNKFNED